MWYYYTIADQRVTHYCFVGKELFFQLKEPHINLINSNASSVQMLFIVIDTRIITLPGTGILIWVQYVFFQYSLLYVVRV